MNATGHRSPKTLNNADLVMSYFTLGRQHPIDHRIATAAAAGYASIGLYIGEYNRLKANDQLGWVDELIAQHGITIGEIEVVAGWAQHGEPFERNATLEASAWEMADRWDCRYLQAIGPYDGTIADAGNAFGALCDRAGEHGLVVGLEFLPFTNIFNARDGMAIVEHADRNNGGLCVDIWHHARGSNDLEMIRAIPADRVFGIQMNDGTREPQWPADYKEDCLRYRVPPGQGEFGAQAFVDALRDIGVTVPWSLEVCNTEAQSTLERSEAHVHACFDAMRALLV